MSPDFSPLGVSSVHEERAEIVRWMYQSYSTGKIVREIIEELTARGVTHLGKPFKANTIYKILRLEKYIGIYRHGDRNKLPRPCGRRRQRQKR